jgi:hypothetical protein
MTVKQAEKNFGIEIIDARSGAPLDPITPDHPAPKKRGQARKNRISDKTSINPRPQERPEPDLGLKEPKGKKPGPAIESAPKETIDAPEPDLGLPVRKEGQGDAEAGRRKAEPV